MHKIFITIIYILTIQSQVFAQQSETPTLGLEIIEPNHPNTDTMIGQINPDKLQLEKSVLEQPLLEQDTSTEIPLSGPKYIEDAPKISIEQDLEPMIEPAETQKFDPVIQAPNQVLNIQPDIEPSLEVTETDLNSNFSPETSEGNNFPVYNALEIISTSGPYYIFKSDFHPQLPRAPKLYPVKINQEPATLQLLKRGEATQQITQGFADNIFSSYLNSIILENTEYSSITFETVSIQYLNTLKDSTGKQIHQIQTQDVTAYASGDENLMLRLYQEAKNKMQQAQTEYPQVQHGSPFQENQSSKTEYSNDLSYPNSTTIEIAPVNPDDIAPGALDESGIKEFYKNQP